MKRILAIVLTLCMTAMAAGCVGDSGETPTVEESPLESITRPSMDIEPIDPGQTLPLGTAAQPTETGAQTADVSAAAIDRLFGPICHYLQDGGSDQVYQFDATQKQSDDFYQGVVYFYLCAIEGQQGEAIGLDTTGDEYNISAEDLRKLFTGYFGSQFEGDMETIFQDKLADDGRYRFDMSDGPSYSAKLLSAEGGDSVQVEVQAIVEGEDGTGNSGAFSATLLKDDASIFGYTISSYTFTPAE